MHGGVGTWSSFRSSQCGLLMLVMLKEKESSITLILSSPKRNTVSAKVMSDLHYNKVESGERNCDIRAMS